MLIGMCLVISLPGSRCLSVFVPGSDLLSAEFLSRLFEAFESQQRLSVCLIKRKQSRRNATRPRRHIRGSASQEEVEGSTDEKRGVQGPSYAARPGRLHSDSVRPTSFANQQLRNI